MRIAKNVGVAARTAGEEIVTFASFNHVVGCICGNDVIAETAYDIFHERGLACCTHFHNATGLAGEGILRNHIDRGCQRAGSKINGVDPHLVEFADHIGLERHGVGENVRVVARAAFERVAAFPASDCIGRRIANERVAETAADDVFQVQRERGGCGLHGARSLHSQSIRIGKVDSYGRSTLAEVEEIAAAAGKLFNEIDLSSRGIDEYVGVVPHAAVEVVAAAAVVKQVVAILPTDYIVAAESEELVVPNSAP